MTLQHVSLETRPGDAPAEARFWSLLGFAEVAAPETLAGRVTWLAKGPTQIHLLHTGDPVVMPRGHVAVVCADYAETLKAVAAAGHEVQERSPHWGAARAMLRSPAGHRVEVMAFPPPAAG